MVAYVAVALYPGSFDPIHNGHLAIIDMASAIFERVVVGVGHNPAKPSGLFTPDERIEMIRLAVEERTNADRVEVVAFVGLVTTAAADAGATCLVKGLRSTTDLDVEMLQANMNQGSSEQNLPTVFLPGLGESALISSRYVREIASAGGDVGFAVPTVVADRLDNERMGR